MILLFPEPESEDTTAQNVLGIVTAIVMPAVSKKKAEAQQEHVEIKIIMFKAILRPIQLLVVCFQKPSVNMFLCIFLLKNTLFIVVLQDSTT